MTILSSSAMRMALACAMIEAGRTDVVVVVNPAANASTEPTFDFNLRDLVTPVARYDRPRRRHDPLRDRWGRLR